MKGQCLWEKCDGLFAQQVVPGNYQEATNCPQQQQNDRKNSRFSWQAFEEKYFVDEATLNDLKNYAAKDSIHLNLNNAEQKSQLAKQIKVLTARQIWRTEGFFEINNIYDETVKKALELMGARPLSALIRKHIK